MVKKMICEEEMRHGNMTAQNKEKLEELRSSEEALRRMSDSYTQKVDTRKREVHRLKMKIAEEEIVKE